jgi:sugar/nucleoside kinase (ribokinase family)
LPTVRVLCLGETLVALICERPVPSLAQADSFAPHFGGAMAHVAVVAARHGADVELAGGAGGDDWGTWLRDRIAAEGVGLEWFELVRDVPTPLSFVTVDLEGRARVRRYGADATHAALAHVAPRLGGAAQACDAFVFTSDALLDEREREATMHVRAQMLEHDKPVVFDPGFRLDRWSNPGRAVTLGRGCLPGLFLLKCNRHEAELLSGEPDPEAAAKGLLAGGVRNVVISLGDQGAMLRGEVKANVPARPARMVDAAGAGDALLGVLVARLAQSDFYPAALALGLKEAVEQAARAVETYGPA